jgi:hypothetical protein
MVAQRLLGAGSELAVRADAELLLQLLCRLTASWHGTEHVTVASVRSHLVRDLVGFARDGARNSAGSVSSLDLIPAQSPKLGISSRVRT